jgi:mRNA interferase MazF
VIKEGQIVLFAFPQTDQASGKLRPALVLRRCPGTHDDWLISMVSSQLRQTIPGVDEIINPQDSDFPQTGLKPASVVRVTRIAVVASGILQGTIGVISDTRLEQIRRRIAGWILGSGIPEAAK